MDKTRIFEDNRRTLEGIAYRMLGTLADARDVVQDTWLKWSEADTAAIQSPRAWLITVCSRKALNLLQSARRQREHYVGEWLPEPLPEDASFDLAARMELDESVSVALLVALEKLSPGERAAWLLHDIFDLGFEEVATILARADNARQLAARARRRVQAGAPASTPRRRSTGGCCPPFRRGGEGRLEACAPAADHVDLCAGRGGKGPRRWRTPSTAAAVGEVFVRVFGIRPPAGWRSVPATVQRLPGCWCSRMAGWTPPCPGDRQGRSAASSQSAIPTSSSTFPVDNGGQTRGRRVDEPRSGVIHHAACDLATMPCYPTVVECAALFHPTGRAKKNGPAGPFLSGCGRRAQRLFSSPFWLAK